VQQSALRRHLLSPTQKAALAAASDGAGVLVAPLTRVAVATATEDECKAVLGTVRTPAQEGTLPRYDGATPWPSTPDAPHVEAVPCLSLRHDTVACVSCRTASRSAAELGKVHEAGEPPQCTNRRWFTVPTQALQRNNKTQFFPVASVRTESVIASTEPPAGAPAPSSATLPLRLFLGATAAHVNGRGRGDNGSGGSSSSVRPGEQLTTSEASSASQSGALLRTFPVAETLLDVHWTAQAVVDHVAFFPPGAGRGCAGDGSGRGAAASDVRARGSSPQWLLFCALKSVVGALFQSALKHLRGCDLTIVRRLAVGGYRPQHSDGGGAGADWGAGGGRRRPVNVSEGDPAVERCAQDVALLLYVFVRVAALAGRSDVKRLADGLCVPTLVPDNVLLAGQVQTEFTKAVDDATREIGGSGRGGGGNRGGDDPSSRIGDAVGGRRLFLAPVSALLHGLCHAEYDPRPTTGGEQTKAQVDISWVMPFLALSLHADVEHVVA